LLLLLELIALLVLLLVALLLLLLVELVLLLLVELLVELLLLLLWLCCCCCCCCCCGGGVDGVNTAAFVFHLKPWGGFDSWIIALFVCKTFGTGWGRYGNGAAGAPDFCLGKPAAIVPGNDAGAGLRFACKAASAGW